ncbi:MAG: PLP-dependent aminotransferase family protein [Gemmatimonadales bacterium]|nr:PLP-dependent aminotransferase family protein [Gemmatimonadales bacterium]MYG50388.1 PLP-dependent aminotransferase family protein [Gemmatimonadales bacterium]MYK02762.1 PLP-dependent aminotransferase family protein [Candidatus Palauibacter ramosifaciens]
MYENMIEIDRGASESLQMQVRRQMAIAIVNRQFPPNEPLPSVRRLAADIKVSVTTVVMVYKALMRDGFVVSRDRSGYFVNPDVLADPGHALESADLADDAAPSARVDYAKFFRGRSFDRQRVVKPADSLVRYRYPFACGLIDPSLFPVAQWRECVRDAVGVVGVGNCATDFSETDDQMLIEQLIQRVLARRGIVARPDEILVTVGGQQALYIAMRLLLAPGETLGVEDPGYPDVVNMARIEGINVRRLPVDRWGLVLSERLKRCKCLFVTPSHQFPTTVTMPLARKTRLLELTTKRGQFVIEDDYEAEISFNKTPPRALKSLDRWGNVIYVGGLSKSLLQGLRLGYLVADREFIREARALRHYMLRHPPVNNQRSVALFLQRGYFDRFVAKLTAIYSRRCDVMHEALERHFPGGAVKPEYGGAIIWLELPEDVDAAVLHDLVEPDGVFFETGGFTFSDERSNRNHVRLGYSVIDESLIAEGIDRIAGAVPGARAAAPAPPGDRSMDPVRGD